MRQTLWSGSVLTVLVLGCSSSSPTAPAEGAAGSPAGTPQAAESRHWVGTWACSPQQTETSNLPPSPGLAGNTLRQVVHVSIGGSELRLRLSNEFGSEPVTMNSVHFAASKGGGAIDPSTDCTVTFGGLSSVTIPAGEAVLSDPFEYSLAPLSDQAISIHFGEVSGDITGHPGSRATSYLETGDAVTAETLASAVKTVHWYFISGIDVMADSSSAAVVVLGDSITDGRGSTVDANNRWPDQLARRLQENPATQKVGVLNQGIGGNAVVSGGLGPTARRRFDRDVLGQAGARWVIVLEGVNDIGYGNAETVANLISTYETFIDKAHQKGLRIYGVPILPFGGSEYDSPDHESARQAVNDWIRTSGRFDAVIDLDAAVCDPEDPSRLLPDYDSGDHLHLNPAGYQQMAEAVDLALFAE